MKVPAARSERGQPSEGSRLSKSFDLVAIGSGAAASGVAMKCRKAGWSVTLIDSQPFGGTCAVRGCDPKKVLVGATEALDWTARLEGKGIRVSDATIDWPELMRFKRSFTDPVPGSREKTFTEAGSKCFTAVPILSALALWR